ncbi:hypothetical protein SD457_02780 [Coprobacillaceae bacterium CR2/5/TPMF4]|nr:hypothetical protein SD457_02780 [Coprobacillaceae bacterium CR2/5/TPMF4]
MTLMEIALKENRLDDAKYIADVDKQAAKNYLIYGNTIFILPIFSFIVLQKIKLS